MMVLQSRGRIMALVVLLAGILVSRLPGQDCNGNLLPDSVDLNEGTSLDCNNNRTPDECEIEPLEFGSTGFRIPFEGIIRTIAGGDVNGDGFSDLALSQSTKVLVLLGSDDSFSDPVEYDVGETVVEIVVTDLNDDGVPDLAAAGGTAVHVFRNVGAERLELVGDFPTPPNANSLTTADVNGDGKIDLLTTRFRPGQAQFSVLVGRGDGTFEEPVSHDTGVRSENLAVGDVDGDGDQDVVVPELRSRSLQFFHNDGDGNFTAEASVLLPADPGRIHGGDFDGDGRMDLLLHFPRENTLQAWIHAERGTFFKRSLGMNSSRGALLSDLDADGDLDIATGASDSGIVIHRNSGTGSFGTTMQSIVQVGRMAAGDYDGDDDLDIAVVNGNDLRVIWRGSRGRVNMTGLTTGPGINPHGIAIADYTGDGHQDVAVPNGGGGDVTVFRNDGEGRLRVHSASPRFGGRFDSLSSGDVDNDGDIDLLSASSHAGNVVLLRNNGEGRFQLQGFPSGNGTEMAAFGDIDGNGFLDLLGANLNGDSVTVVFNEDGATFDRSQTLAVGQRPWAVVAADLDGDGDNDLATSNGASFDVSVIVNAGEGQFEPDVRYPASGATRYIVSGDLDHDGDIDLAAAGAGSVAVILLNHGDATFAPAVNYPLDRAPYSMFAADVDGDGNLDLATANETSSTLSLVLGEGDGTFSPPLVFAVGQGLRFAAGGDLDSDGDIDVVTANRGSDDLTVLLNGRFQGLGGVTHRESICTPLDFHGLSVPQGADAVSRSLKFLAPAREDATLLSSIFQHTGRFPQHREFLMTVFPERFPALDATRYATLVAQRATRDYFAGRLGRVKVEGQVFYGFDLVVDESPDEVLTLEEVRQVFETLDVVVTLPGLAYAPGNASAREAASGWKDPGFPVLLLDEPTPPPVNEPPLEGTPTFTLEIPEDLVICGTFATATADRGPAEEYALKSQVRLRGGSIELPTAENTFTAELFEEVRFGPSQERAQSAGEGQFRVLGIPGPERSTVYRFTYDKDYVLADGRELRLSWVRPIQLRARGEEKLDEKLALSEEFFVVEVGSEALQASLDGVRLVRYGSCSYQTLPRFDVRVELEDGSRFRFDERFLEQESLLATGPASVLRAELELAETTRVVDDYWQLVYSALRHNTAVRYRVMLDPALPTDDGDVRAVEVLLDDPPRSEVEATYLGGDFEVLRTVAGTYEKTPVALATRFLRGDAGADGTLDVTDALRLLQYLFRREALPCVKAADTNDDGQINVIDAVRVLSQLFGRIESLPRPFPTCGEDPTEDGLPCETLPPCAAL